MVKKYIVLLIIILLSSIHCNDTEITSDCMSLYNLNNLEIVIPPEDMKIFVVIGQSNASGGGKLENEDMAIMENVYLLVDDNNHWIRAVNPLNNFSNIRVIDGSLGFAYSFALELINDNPNESIGLIVNARGGSNIYCWQKGALCYECTMKRLISMDYDINGFLVHQGESDYNNPNWLYFASEMVNDFRYDLSDERMPFVFGELARFAPHLVDFNQRINGLFGLVDNIGIVSSVGLTGIDTVHFNRDSQTELGKRYFETMYELY